MHNIYPVKWLFSSLFILILFAGCGGGSDESTIPASETHEHDTEMSSPGDWLDALEYLNDIRRDMGMVQLQNNELLSIAAENHALFLKENDTEDHNYGHYEQVGLTYFTGVTPQERVRYMNYDGYTGEGIAPSDGTYTDGVKILMTAIYHRFGMLSLTSDEIGGGAATLDDYHYYVLDSGNSKTHAMCAADYPDDTIYEEHYSDVCIDETKIIPADVFIDAYYFSKRHNPEVMVYPYEDQRAVQTTFHGEHPDPLPDLPDYPGTGNPISIVFNDLFVETVSLISFRLYDDDSEIGNVRVLTKDTDPQERFSTFQYALFPLEPLKPGVTYRVEADLLVDGASWKKSWSFTTDTESIDELTTSTQRANR